MNISVHRAQNKTKKLFTRKSYAELTATPSSRDIIDEGSLEFSGTQVEPKEVPSGLNNLSLDEGHRVRATLRLGKSMKAGRAIHIALEYRLTVTA